MSEGIIQEVIKPYISRARRYNDDPYYGELNEKSAKEFEQLQKELIEKIIMLNVFQNNPMLMKLLIGDSK